MAVQDALDQLWAELLATKFMCSQMYAFLALANRDQPDWLLKQRIMLLQHADALKFEGHPNETHMKRLVRDAIERSIQELSRVQVGMGSIQ
jgi:hypothetical protein